MLLEALIASTALEMPIAVRPASAPAVAMTHKILQPAPELPKAVDPKAIADRFRARYWDLPFLRFTARIQAGKELVTAHTQMGRGKLRTDVFREGQLFYAISIVGDAVQEFVPSATIGDGGESRRHVLIEYDLLPELIERTNVGHVIMIDHETCCRLFGNLTASWVIRGESTPDTFAEKLEESKFDRYESVDGHKCLVMRYFVSALGEKPLETKTLTQLFYLDADSTDLRRWETTEAIPAAGKSASRTVDYVDIEHGLADEGWVWRLNRNDLREPGPQESRPSAPTPGTASTTRP